MTGMAVCPQKVASPLPKSKLLMNGMNCIATCDPNEERMEEITR
jgi:hypothetical protein